jgi:L,D-transpeptidase ErfK/SrfK
MWALVAILFVAQLAGGDFTYTVQVGDSLVKIGARFAVDARVIAETNQLKSDKLAIAQVLEIDNRHIIPPPGGSSILINVPQRMLFYFPPQGAPMAFPVAAGRTGWKTETGEFEVATMEKDPTWDVPVSIQNEMRRNGKPVLTHVPPSPENPLGSFWIGLNLGGIGIHGTNAPSSIYKLVTHGCVRLHPDDIRELFSMVNVGMRGIIIYEPVLVTRAGNDVFLEVHPDPYRSGGDPLHETIETARAGGFLQSLDLALVKEVIERRDGVARNVTRR